MKKKKLLVKFKLDKDKCKGCGLCIQVCPSGILRFSSGLNRQGFKYAEIKDVRECKGCGFCFLICPEVCIEVRRLNEKKGFNLGE